MLSWIAMALIGIAHPHSFAQQNSKPLIETTGSQWFKLPTVDYKGKQDDIFFVNAELGFYANGQGKIYRSNDMERAGNWFSTNPALIFVRLA